MTTRTSNLRRRLAKVRALRAVHGAVAGLLGPHQRALRRIERDRPGRLLQPSPVTREDRWPAIFAFVAHALAGRPAPRILSYGCSTGEEVFSLARLLPEARITGADINPRSLASARARLATAPDPRIDFRLCASPDELAPETYDAIFCMAVIRHGRLLAETPARCGHILPFAKAEALAAALAARVRPGGDLAIWCTQFRFTDMTASRDFDAVMADVRGDFFNWPLYGPDDHRLDGVRCDTAVFRRAP